MGQMDGLRVIQLDGLRVVGWIMDYLVGCIKGQ